jgi:hypothetical protein
MSVTPETSSARVCAGVDRAEDDHAVCVVDSEGEAPARFSVVHDAAGLKDMVLRLLKANVTEVGIERPALLARRSPLRPRQPHRAPNRPQTSDGGAAVHLSDSNRIHPAGVACGLGSDEAGVACGLGSDEACDGEVPHPHRAVVGAGDDDGAAVQLADSNRIHPARVAGERGSDGRAGGQVPHPHGAVAVEEAGAGDDDGAAVQVANSNRLHRAFVAPAPGARPKPSRLEQQQRLHTADTPAVVRSQNFSTEPGLQKRQAFKNVRPSKTY